jgi:Fe-Mn family superoxide dismutase
MTEQITLITLPYAKTALAPIMGEATLIYHYDHLAKGYVDRNNAGEEFNGAPAYLHNIFFEQFMPPVINPNNTGENQEDLFVEQYLDIKPSNISSEVITKAWGTFEEFQTQFEATALLLKGSGWIYLDTAGKIKTIKDHSLIESLSQVMFLVDLWEHAWALDYTWNKPKYLKNIWKIVNWQVVNNRMLDYQKTVEQYAIEAIAGLDQSV